MWLAGARETVTGRVDVPRLELKQPWSNLIARGQNMSCRSWRTDFRGDLIICSGAAVDQVALLCFDVDPEPRGVTSR